MINFNKFLEIAFALNGKHKFNQRCKHFSFIYEKNKIISIGINNSKTHPLNLRYNYINKQKSKISHIVGTHSEMKAVIKSGLSVFQNMTIINIRINRKNKIDYSCPCNGCLEMLMDLNFSKIYYTTKDGKFQKYQKNAHHLT
jgi:deoxycytidylate deaminase